MFRVWESLYHRNQDDSRRGRTGVRKITNLIIGVMPIGFQTSHLLTCSTHESRSFHVFKFQFRGNSCAQRSASVDGCGKVSTTSVDDLFKSSFRKFTDYSTSNHRFR